MASTYCSRRIGYGIGAFFLALIAGLFTLSFFLDGIIRPRIEQAMNEKLKGYHTSLSHAHLQIIGARLSLRALKIIEEKAPNPPVAQIDKMQFTIQWRELLTGHIVADVLLVSPKVRIDTRQFQAEKTSKTPVRQEGWQDALENIYPLKINRFRISNGNLTYIDANDPEHPLRLEQLGFTADNIRNIHYQANQYPSPIHMRAKIFGQGSLAVDGKANFLEEPYPGVRVSYRARDIPLNVVTPAAMNVNLVLRGGTLASQGLLEYSPKVARVEVDNGTLDGVDMTYIHTAETDTREKQNVNAAGKSIEKENNRPAVVILIRRFELRAGTLAYEDKEKNPNFKLTLAKAGIMLANYSNHQEQGVARIALHGNFMGSGDTSIDGTFLATQQGPQFDVNIAIKNTDMTSMNNLLLAFGRFDVKQGEFTVYSQINVKDGNISGYVKPMFSDLTVYDWSKDKHRPVLHQAYEATVGAAGHLFKNSKTQQVATEVNLSGKLKNPDTSTWQAVIEVLQNAFIQAILPGFDRQLQLARNQAQ